MIDYDLMWTIALAIFLGNFIGSILRGFISGLTTTIIKEYRKCK